MHLNCWPKQNDAVVFWKTLSFAWPSQMLNSAAQLVLCLRSFGLLRVQLIISAIVTTELNPTVIQCTLYNALHLPNIGMSRLLSKHCTHSDTWNTFIWPLLWMPRYVISPAWMNSNLVSCLYYHSCLSPSVCNEWALPWLTEVWNSCGTRAEATNHSVTV